MKQISKGFWLDTAFFAALLLKVFGAGFTYFCVLDDYIQYGCYPMYPSLQQVYFKMGTAATRPLAAFLDPALWGAFFQNMAVALLILTVLHFLSAKWMEKAMGHFHISIKPLLYSVYLLLPLGFEGTYWISASSRIVVGLLFASLAACLLIRLLEKGTWWLFLLYTLATLLSYGFYESVMVLAACSQGLILLAHCFKEKRYKALFLLAVPVFCGVCLLLYYKLAAQLLPQTRVSSFTLANMGGRIKSLFSQLGYIFTAGIYRTTVCGFTDGLKIVAELGALGVLLFVLLVAVSVLCGICSGKVSFSAKAKWCVPTGLILALAPLLPNLLVEDVWLTYRSIVACLPGVCLMLAPLFCWLCKKRAVTSVLFGVCTFVLLVGCVNELYTYKRVYEEDQRMLECVLPKLDAEVRTYQKEAVLVLSFEPTPPQTSFYKDHVKSVFYTDWSLTGAMRAKAGSVLVHNIIPVRSLEGVVTEGRQVLYMDEHYHVTEGQ